LLAGLDAGWPVPVASYALVGHSMGGLVARSAAHQGDAAGAGWTPRLRTVVALGSPHLGAPLEQAAHVADVALRAVPESAPLSRVLASRSVGIRDLRYGAIVAQDWDGHDPDEFLRDRCSAVPLLGHVSYCWVSASLTSNPAHPVGALLGDGLVRRRSASGQGHPRRPAWPVGNGLHVAGADHVRLLNHPDVYRALAGWVAG
jgi:alpha-beta hydrolase superfamily lysophospholipase